LFKKALKSSLFSPKRLHFLSVLLLSSVLLTAGVRADETFLENGVPFRGGEDTGFMLDSPFRHRVDLSGMWQYTVDGGGVGQVRLPAAYDFVGDVNFTRTVPLTAEQIGDYTFHLVMFGVNYRCDAFINGEFVASHEGGYTSIVREIPDAVLQPGAENQIRIQVGNRLDSRMTIPVRLQVWGWRNYGGVLRDIFLLATPRVYIRDVSIRSTVAKGETQATIAVEPAIDGVMKEQPDGSKSSVGFYCELVDKISGEPVARSKTVRPVQSERGWVSPAAEITVSQPKLWSTDHPDLYILKSYLVMQSGKEETAFDELDLNYGIRTVEIADGGFLVNGAPFTLKGVVWNEDHPTWGSSLPHEQMEKDVVMIKAMGANAIRFAHHPPHPYMLNLCDRYGLFAFLELPVAFLPSSVLQDEYYTQLTRNMMREMVARDRSHASVFAWGIGEGFESSAMETRPFVDSVAVTARRLDSRPVYYSSVMYSVDVCSDLVDIAAIDIYTTDPASFKQRLADWKEMHPGKPVIVSKFGKEVQHENRNGYSDPHSQEAQARFLLHRLDDIRNQKYNGAFVWSFNDWRSDRPVLTVASGDPWMLTMGLVNPRREKRLAMDAVRSVFRGEKYVALPAGNYSSTAPIVYVLGGLVLLIGTAYLYNSDRRFRESVNRSTLNSYNFFSDIRDQRAVSIFHSTMIGMITSSALAIVTSTALYHSRESWVVDAALSFLLPSDPVKEFVISLIHSPLSLILHSAAAFFITLVLIALCVFVAARLLKSRLYPYHAYTVTMWATVPMLMLIPVGMILFRLLEGGEYVVPSFVLVCSLLVWTVLRIHKGVAVVADIYRPKVYALGFTSILVVVVIGYFLLDYSQSASEYLRFLYNVASNSY